MEERDIQLLADLIRVRGASSDESGIKEFIKNYVLANAKHWKVQPKIVEGGFFQDTLLLVFGQPKTVIFSHIDTIGFSVGYNQELIKIGGAKLIDGTRLVGKDSSGEVEAELVLIENEDGDNVLKYVADRRIDRGTILTFLPDFRINETYVQSAYLDNRLGNFVALKVAETLENGAIAFSTYEEHGGNTVGYMANYLFQNYGVAQALIADITWVTEGVKHGGGVAISMRDSLLPRRSYLNRIIDLVASSGIAYQLEVESGGGSDGGMLQKSDLPFDWCFIGAAEDNVHSPNEKVFISDIQSMVEVYNYLMEHL
ncbi:MAG: M20/M25/M40 family metallo-hydrolase [Crocinitomicaceae bacterium]|nr:M20/M25/M40 family metallo-hydrolase [Crocinitomicaceae bacterium]